MLTTSSQNFIVKYLKAANHKLSHIKQCCYDQPIFGIIQRCAHLSIIIAFILFLYGYCITDKYSIKDFQHINQAWQTGSYDRIFALEYTNDVTGQPIEVRYPSPKPVQTG